MLLLHRSLAAVAKIASKEKIRYALTGVKIEDLGVEKLRIQASDGKRAIRVTEEKDDKMTFPKVRGFDPAANGSKETVIDAEAFLKILTEIPKSNRVPQLEYAAVTLEKEDVTFAAYTKSENMKRVTPLVPLTGEFCKYPPTDQVYPKDKPAFRVHFNPKLLGDLLLQISSLIGPHDHSVILEFYTDSEADREAGKPSPARGMTLKAKNPYDHRQIEAIIMPLTKTQ